MRTWPVTEYAWSDLQLRSSSPRCSCWRESRFGHWSNQLVEKGCHSVASIVSVSFTVATGDKVVANSRVRLETGCCSIAGDRQAFDWSTESKIDFTVVPRPVLCLPFAWTFLIWVQRLATALTPSCSEDSVWIVTRLIDLLLAGQFHLSGYL